MEEKEQREKELEQFEAQDGLSISTKINELAMALTARVETVNIVTEVLNSWLNVRQSNEKIKLSETEIAAIQAAINQVNNKTNELFNELTAVSEKLIKSQEKK